MRCIDHIKDLKKNIPSMMVADALHFETSSAYEKYWEESSFAMKMLPSSLSADFYSVVFSWARYGLPLSVMSSSGMTAEKINHVDESNLFFILPIKLRAKYKTECGEIQLDNNNNKHAVLLPSHTLIQGAESGSALFYSLNFQRLVDTASAIWANDYDESQISSSAPKLVEFEKKSINYFSAIKSLSDTAAVVANRFGAVRDLGLDDNLYRITALMLTEANGQTGNKKEAKRAFSKHVVDDVLDWILANLHHPITLTKLERVSGLSARSLQLMFAQHLEMTPMSWVREQRLQMARHLLKTQSELFVSDVAMMCGFTTADMLTASYKQRFGCPPSQDRIRHL
jgi:AraC-like DNA-binding protein